MKAFTLCAALLLPLMLTPVSGAAPRSSTATIISTGDRLTPGYSVTVSPQGVISSALVPRGRRRAIRRTDRMITVNRQRFFADLAAAGPLNRVRAGASGSFPRVFVRYHGQLSPNLRAAHSTSGKALYQDVKQILQVLRLPIPDQP